MNWQNRVLKESRLFKKSAILCEFSPNLLKELFTENSGKSKGKVITKFLKYH